MTMICLAKNKAELRSKLEAGCAILEPTPFGDKWHLSETFPVGRREAVVLDPATRRRFATIEKTAGGQWLIDSKRA